MKINIVDMKQHSFVFKVKIKFNVSTIINTKDKNDACVLVAALLKYYATIRDIVNLAGRCCLPRGVGRSGGVRNTAAQGRD